ncbi:hypothetical protein HC031_03430 [Planosporangium thailandense]|uniref:Uncharacterized protein n=1 Tax=Planosporangium thailandense TaxID=765197 RepID=A0ABX0XRZ8_9ACTN|nr:hypothetical protein [Planosporangium thailandense]NJC68781.1 hypothetical protein [Planosporangium thailandense]
MDVTTTFGLVGGFGMLAFSIGAFGVLDAWHKRNPQRARVDWLIRLYVVGVLVTVAGVTLAGRWWMAAPFALMLLPADRAVRLRAELRQRRVQMQKLKGE